MFYGAGSNRKHKNNTGPLQDEDGHLTNRDKDKVELFNAFLAAVFNTDDAPRGFQCPELENHDCKNDPLPPETQTGTAAPAGFLEIYGA